MKKLGRQGKDLNHWSTFQTISIEELQSMKTAPIVDSTISAKTLGASTRPLECKG